MATEGEEYDKATINPQRLNFGVVSAGFLYKLKFSVQNNTKAPMRMRISCSNISGGQNTIKLVNLPDIVAPGLSAILFLELTAEFPMSSKFLVTVTQNHSSAVYTKEVDVNVVSVETFKHVKKSLLLQKRPLYQPNVTVFANIPNFDTLTDDLPNYSSSATFSEAALLDDDDIEDLLSLPMTHNIYWDPFAKRLRLDPKLGKVIVDSACTLEENRKKTMEGREERMVELEEQGFLTINSIARMREERQQLQSPGSPCMTANHSAHDEHSPGAGGDPHPHSAETASEQDAAEAEEDDTFADVGLDLPGLGAVEVEHEDDIEGAKASPYRGLGVTFSEDGEDHGASYCSQSSATSRMSVTSMLAMKRERIERQRRESVQMSSSFSETSKQDTKIDKNRTLSMIRGRGKPNLMHVPEFVIKSGAMKARLDEKVGKLRSQIMSFANDGIQVSLNIPDTSDVKETFGTVINSVVEQHDEILDLQTGLETATVETAESQRKLLVWTASCVQKLKEENEKLQSKLLDANKQIKNLSYNMQGYVDPTAAEDGETMPEPLEFDELPQIKQHGKDTLFPTEEGAQLGSESMVITPKVRTFVKFKGAEQREKSLAMYNAVPPNTMPNNLRARWRWAIRKIMSALRKKRMKVGLTRSRMDPKQTFAGRLDRVEAMMLGMHGDLRAQLAEADKRINHKVNAEVGRLNLEVSAAAGKLHMLAEDSGARFKALQEEVGQVEATMREFFAKVQQQSSGDTMQLRETLKAVEVHLKDLAHMGLESLRCGVNFVTSELDQMEGSADKLLQLLESLHVVSSSQPPFDTHKPIEQAMSDLTDLLQIDTQYREARQELVRLQASSASVSRAYNTVNQQVLVAGQHYGKESVQAAAIELMSASQVEDLNELSQRCVGADSHIKHIDTILSSLDRLCMEHDKVLKDRLRIFVALSHKLRDVGTMAEQLGKTQPALSAKLSLAAPKSPSAAAAFANAAAAAGMTAEQVQMLARFESSIEELTLRVGVIEGMNALDEAIGFEEEGEEEEQEEQKYTGKPPPVVPQDAIVQDRFTSEKGYSRKTFASLNAPSAEEGVKIVCIDSAPSTLVAEANTTSVSIAPEPVGFHAPSTVAEERAAAPAPSSTIDIQIAAVTAATNAATSRTSRAFSPSDPGVGASSGGANTRKGSAYSNRANSEKRKASAVASLDMLEARLRPLIEAIVAANVEEKLLSFEGNMNGALDGDEGDEFQEEGRDEFLAEPVVSAPLLSGTAAVNGESAAEGVNAATSPHPRDEAPARPSRQSSTVEFGGARIRREASRFGGMGDAGSGKARSGSSKSGKRYDGIDLAPYVAEISSLKKESSRLGKLVGKLEDGRLTSDDVERMFHHLYQTHHHNEQKEESNHHIHELERRVDKLTKEITSLHAAHTKAIAALQAEFSETLHSVVAAAAQSLDADNKESFVSTRALCLGCGRNSTVRAHPEARPTSPSFFPQINHNSTEGPDVYHGGFKMPVKNPLNPTYVLEASCHSPGTTRARTVKSAGQRMQEALVAAGSLDASVGSSSLVGNALEAVLPRVKTAQPRPHTSHHPRHSTVDGVNIEDDDLEEEFSFVGEGSHVMNITGGALEDPSRVTTAENGSLIIQASKGYQLNIASSTSPVRVTSALKVVRSARPEQEELRPVYRKGFPAAKKSIRAETAYAHDRFELDMPSNILLHSSKVANAALVPGSESIASIGSSARPYSSQERSRPRLVQQGVGSKMSATSMHTSSSTTKF